MFISNHIQHSNLLILLTKERGEKRRGQTDRGVTQTLEWVEGVGIRTLVQAVGVGKQTLVVFWGRETGTRSGLGCRD